MVHLHTHPALLIVDMQNGFCHPQGTFTQLGLPIANMRAVIPAISRLRSTLHSHNQPVFFTRMGFAVDYSDSGIIVESLPQLRELKGFVRGTWDAEIVSELAPDETAGEAVVDKTRNTVFWGTDFAQQIRDRGVDHLVVVGVGTNVCVESTVRDASKNGVHVVTVGDATATSTEEDHQASLRNLAWFGGVATIEEIEKALEELI